eukprot:815619-Pleurochrysis_carterae.AAC.1
MMCSLHALHLILNAPRVLNVPTAEIVRVDKPCTPSPRVERVSARKEHEASRPSDRKQAVVREGEEADSTIRRGHSDG